MDCGLTGPDEGYVEHAELNCFSRKDHHYHWCGERHRPRHRADLCTSKAPVVCGDINEKGADETAAEVNVITLSVRSPTHLAL
jgi:hypothetical protein